MLQITQTGDNEFLIIHGGYAIPMAQSGNELISKELPRPAYCPNQATTCNAPIQSVTRLSGGHLGADGNEYVRIAFEAPDLYNGFFELKSEADEPMVAEYRNNLLRFMRKGDSKAFCQTLIPVFVEKISVERRKEGLRAYMVMGIILDTSLKDCEASNADRRRIGVTRNAPGIFLVVGKKNDPLALVTVSYTTSEIFYSPKLPREQREAAVRIAFDLQEKYNSSAKNPH